MRSRIPNTQRLAKSLTPKSQITPALLALTLALASSVSLAAPKKDGSNILPKPVAQKKSVVLSVEPIWLLVSGLGAKVDYFVTDKVSLGLGGNYIPDHKVENTSKNENSSINSNFNWSHSELNLGTNIMLTGTLSSSGVYINPTVGYQKTEITHYSSYDLQGSLATPQASATGGYQWVNNGFRIGAGAGYKVLADNDVVVKDRAGAEVYREKASNMRGLVIDFQLGILF
ncbi:MAG: hypothetical protein COT73_03960 [Bdellovibrio sp. CG10_big_fil_rev_8_21_14_0_10_47_8]|nr:MAG: hypothetical protein COT73_03960 [Bdellovibrio sp. CG10_big_fil_rev_8_21_14_0_10_47_8]